MDYESSPELSGVYESPIYRASFTPSPIAYDAQVVAANPTQLYDHLINDGQALRSPTHEVDNDYFSDLWVRVG